MRYLYTLLFTLCIPLILLRLWLRGRKLPAYRQRWTERFGIFPAPNQNKNFIWVHTVSVGEFIAAKPMIDQLLALNNYQLAVTTMTPTGSERVTATYGDKVFHVYAPYDLPFSLSPFLNKIKPRLAVFLETELWPNTLHACAKRNIPTLLANARLSEKSARGYQKVSWLSKPMLQKLSLAAIQNSADAARFKALGLAQEKAEIIGNIKFDIAVSDELRIQARKLKQQLSSDGLYNTWIAASTHKGEDEIILEAFDLLRKQHPLARLILVPRHPDRFNSVFELCEKRGFKTLRRSDNHSTLNSDKFDIYLGDTMGEMMLLFGCADIAFVGGSFVNNGGHNTIEPAVWRLPILSGPSQFNFLDISRMLTKAGGLITVNNSEQLSQQLMELFHQEKALVAGAAAAKVAEQNQGALARLMAIIQKQIASVHDRSQSFS